MGEEQTQSGWAFETLAIHAGQPPDSATGAGRCDGGDRTPSLPIRASFTDRTGAGPTLGT